MSQVDAGPASAVAQRIERPYRVRFDEAGPDGLLRSSGYLRYAQDLAWIHSESAGFGREWYGERGLTWLIRAVEPTRVPREILDIFVESPADFTPIRLDLGDPPAAATAGEVAVRRSELDPMAHVNNAAYLDYLDEHFLAQAASGNTLTVPRRYTGEFVASAEPSATLISRGWQVEDEWRYLLEDETGRAMFRGRLETDPASWVGG